MSVDFVWGNILIGSSRSAYCCFPCFPVDYLCKLLESARAADIQKPEMSIILGMIPLTPPGQPACFLLGLLGFRTPFPRKLLQKFLGKLMLGSRTTRTTQAMWSGHRNHNSDPKRYRLLSSDTVDGGKTNRPEVFINCPVRSLYLAKKSLGVVDKRFALYLSMFYSRIFTLTGWR